MGIPKSPHDLERVAIRWMRRRRAPSPRLRGEGQDEGPGERRRREKHATPLTPPSPRQGGERERNASALMQNALVKIGAKVVAHARYVAFQMAEVAIPRNVFADVLRLIAELRPPSVMSTA